MGRSLIDLMYTTKSFGGNIVLDDLNLSVKENTFATSLGPSNCGKTAALYIIGDFEKTDSSKVIFNGQDTGNTPLNRRQLNTVFQKYALFPYTNTAGNIVFDLKIRNRSKAYTDDKIRYALKLVNLSDLEKRSMDSLSDGQQQRTAIARAIVNEPKILLPDEPLGALDLKLRQDIRYELIHLKSEFGVTFVYVAHDQEETLTMSDIIVVIDQGYTQRTGPPEQICNEPENAFVADFIGENNVVPGIVIRDKSMEMFGSRFACVDKGFGNSRPVDVVIHPEDIDPANPENGILKGVYTHLIFEGVHCEMEVATPDGYEWLVHSTDMCPVGQEMGTHVDPFDTQTMNGPVPESEEVVGVNE